MSYIVLFLLSISIFVFLYLKSSELSDILVKFTTSAALTFFVTSVVKLTPLLISYVSRYSTKNKLCKFFGESIASNSVRFVFSERILSNEYKNKNVWGINYEFLTGHKDYAAIPEGVKAWIPFQDIRAAVYVSTVITKYTDIPPRFILDKEICSTQTDYIDHTAISFGLGFNSFTHQLARLSDYELFKITFRSFPDESCTNSKETDKNQASPPGNVEEKEPAAAGSEAHKEDETKKGEDDNKYTESFTDFINFNGEDLQPGCDHKDYALIARIVLRKHKFKSKNYFFICAGRTATGTAAAGHYLKHNWDNIYKLYNSNNKDLTYDSVVVIIEHKIDRKGLIDFDSDEHIALDKNHKEMVKFYRC